MPETWWEKLPAGLRDAIEGLVGAVAPGDPITARHTSCVVGTLSSERNGDLFVKASSAADNPLSVTGQTHEMRASGYVAPLKLSPQLIGRLEVGGWSAIVQEEVVGWPVSYIPGSPDLGLLVEAMGRLAQVCPPSTSGLPTVAERLGSHILPEDHDLVHGWALLHNDLSPANVLVREGDLGEEELVLVDWGCAARGPKWVGTAGWYPHLRVAGHSHDEALAWVLKASPSWHHIKPATRDAYIRAAGSAYLAAARESPEANKHCGLWADLLEDPS